MSGWSPSGSSWLVRNMHSRHAEEGAEREPAGMDQLLRRPPRVRRPWLPPAATTTLDRAAALIEPGCIACDETVTAVLPQSTAANSIAAFNAHRDHQVKVAIDPWM